MASSFPKLFITIDFEDFSHDHIRSLGLSAPPLRKDALTASYEEINRFLRTCRGKHIVTFFITGIIAEHCPEIVRRIADDGHEIGCHYYHHEDCNHDTPAQFEKKIITSKRLLAKAAGKPVIGFRAPRFSLSMENIAHYRILAKHFAYDASITRTPEEIRAWQKKNCLTGMHFFPVGSYAIPPIPFRVRTGGTYLKLLPAAILLPRLRKDAENGIIPCLYLHPYEFSTSYRFCVRWGQLRGLSVTTRIYRYFRQFQWIGLSNIFVGPRIRKIAKAFELAGPLQSMLTRRSKVGKKSSDHNALYSVTASFLPRPVPAMAVSFRE